MFAQKDGLPTAVVAASLIAGLRDTCTALCMLLAAAAAGGGPTLYACLVSTASLVVEAVTALIRGAAAAATATTAAAESAEQLPPIAGLVMERCDAAAKAPMDDKTAIGRAIASVARQIADASVELRQELGQEKTEEGEEEEDGDNATTSDVVVLELTKGVVDAACDVVRSTMQVLLRADASLQGDGDQWVRLSLCYC